VHPPRSLCLITMPSRGQRMISRTRRRTTTQHQKPNFTSQLVRFREHLLLLPCLEATERHWRYVAARVQHAKSGVRQIFNVLAHEKSRFHSDSDLILEGVWKEWCLFRRRAYNIFLIGIGCAHWPHACKATDNCGTTSGRLSWHWEALDVDLGTF
jgi:hypothetical protein